MIRARRAVTAATRAGWLLLSCLLLACASAAPTQVDPTPDPDPLPPLGHAAEIAAFETADRANPPAPGAVLFVGSSSIRMWTTLATDFPGVRTLNRGFGGSNLYEVLGYAPRIVVPYRPRLIVLYAGENDIASDRTPVQVLANLRSLLALVRRDLPGVRVAFISLKPSQLRWPIVDRIRETNRLVADLATSDRTLLYLDVFTPMLDASGRLRPELYQPDGLHMTAAGYAIWRTVVAPVLR